MTNIMKFIKYLETLPVRATIKVLDSDSNWEDLKIADSYNCFYDEETETLHLGEFSHE